MPCNSAFTGWDLPENWWIFAVSGGVLLALVLLAIVIGCVCAKRSKSASYNVNKMELARGNDPLRELEDDRYQLVHGSPYVTSCLSTLFHTLSCWLCSYL